MKYYAILIFFFIPVFVSAQENSPDSSKQTLSQFAPDKPVIDTITYFRNTKWGMTQDEVIKAENITPVNRDDQAVVFESRVANKDVYIIYIFVDAGLCRAKYVLNERHSNKNDYILDYADLKAILVDKYGEPAKDDKFWKDDLYKNDLSKWGMAVAAGDLLYYSEWHPEGIVIAMMMKGDNYNIVTAIEYSSNELKPIEKNKDKKENLKDF
jgi:hypothetical protein